MSPIFYCRARFIGENGSMGYAHNNTYLLEVRQSWLGTRVSVAPVHGYEAKTIEDMRCPYDTLELMLENWQILQLENGPYKWRRDREDYYQHGH